LYTRGRKLLKKSKEEDVPPLGGNVIEYDEIWSCTTCGACQEHCPVFIEHIDKIIDMRRSMVMMESNFPNELNPVLRNMETQFNPYMMGNDTRADWAEDLGIHRHIQEIWSEEDSHCLSALLQHAEERVSGLRREVPGDTPHRTVIQSDQARETQAIEEVALTYDVS